MSYSVILLADRTVLPLREGGTRSLKNPAVQLDYLSEVLPEDVRVYVLVGFRREDVLNAHTNFLFISNPDPQVERLPAALLHCLKLVDRDRDLFLIEADSVVEKGEIETLSGLSKSSVFHSPCLSQPRARSINFFVRSEDLALFERTVEDGFHHVRDLGEALSPEFDVLDVESPRQIGAVEKRDAAEAALVFDQQ